jgi:Histidine kinase-, DNA gyrase B-, and HSP90-like ATPase
MKKLAIVGASHFVNRMFEACGNYQWAREFLKNALEAGATKVEFGIEWQAVEKLGTYRRTIIDNGCGMSKDELLRFFSTLGDGAKRIGGIHDNFGVGAKIASLPWNPEGVVVISYKDGKPSMIQIELDPDSADYQLVEFQSERGTAYVINPADVDWGEDINWSVIAPEWARTNGTTIILLGSEEASDTILGNPRAQSRASRSISTVDFGTLQVSMCSSLNYAPSARHLGRLAPQTATMPVVPPAAASWARSTFLPTSSLGTLS